MQLPFYFSIKVDAVIELCQISGAVSCCLGKTKICLRASFEKCVCQAKTGQDSTWAKLLKEQPSETKTFFGQIVVFKITNV